MQTTARRTFVGGPRIFSDTKRMPPSPIKMEDKIFSGSVSFTNTVEFIQHYSSCNMLRPHCLQTSNVAHIKMLDSVRSDNNTERTAPPAPRTLFKSVIILTLVII